MKILTDNRYISHHFALCLESKKDPRKSTQHKTAQQRTSIAFSSVIPINFNIEIGVGFLLYGEVHTNYYFLIIFVRFFLGFFFFFKYNSQHFGTWYNVSL